MDSTSNHPVKLWWTLTGDFAWSGLSREPTLTTDGQLYHQETLSRPVICNQHQPNSRAQEELEGKPTLLHNVWRGLQLMFSRPIQIMILFRGGCTSCRETYFMAHGTSDHCPGCREHWLVVVVHKVTLRSVEFASKESSGKRRKGKPVFMLQPLEFAMLLKRALKRVRFAADRVDCNTEVPDPNKT